MKNYLIDTFQFNDLTNRKLIKKISVLSDKDAAIKLVSHLINCQYKWMARISHDPKARGMSWWDPVYSSEDLENEWEKSLKLWTDYIHLMTDEQLSRELTFTGYDEGVWAATPQDIALQLNYHSIHHRAQIQTIIRSQGIEPDFVDYIGTRYRKISD